jgi:hypothetical protein
VAEKETYKGLRIETAPPTGYIPLPEFAERCAVSKSLVSQHKDSGRLNSDHLCWVLPPDAKQYKLYLDWVVLGPPFIMARPKEKWPHGFKPPQTITKKPESIAPELRKPVDRGEIKEQGKIKDEATYLSLDGLKRRKEELAIEKAELELQKARNEVVEIDAVNQTMQNIAALVAKSHETLSIRIGPMFAAETDPDQISRTYKKEVQKMLSEIRQELEQYAPQKT